MHHTGQAPRYALQDTGQGVPVGRVAGFDHHRHVQRGQLLHQLAHTRRVHPPTPDQHQLTHPVAHGQMPGHQTAQQPRTTGDQNSALAPRHFSFHHHVPHQTRHTQHTVPHRHLTLADHQRGPHISQPLVAVRLDQHEPARILRLRRPHQTRHHTARTPRHHHQPRGFEPRIGQPGPHHSQHPSSRPVDVRPVEAGQDHHLGRALHRAQLRVVTIKHHHLPRELPLHRPRRNPVQAEQVVGGGRTGGSDGVSGDRAQGERLDRGDGAPRRVGQCHAAHVRTGGRETYPHVGGATRVQGHPLEDERQPYLVVRRVGAGQQGVQRGVQQSGVETEAARALRRVLRQRHFRVEVVAQAPSRAQPLEHRPVHVPAGDQVAVEAVEVHRFGTGWRPGFRGEGCFGPALGQDAGGVPGPAVGRVLVGVLREHRHRAGPVGLRGTDDDLNPYGTPLGDGQRCFQGEFVDMPVTHLVPGPDRQFHDGRARQEDGPGDGVVTQPGVRGERQPAGQDDAVPVAERHGRAQQGVAGLGQPQTARVSGGSGTVQPVAAALEGVGGEVGSGGTCGADERGPVDRQTVDVRFAQGGGEAAQVALVTAQGAQDDRGILDRALDRCRQDRVGTGLDERVEAVRQQQTHRLLETDRLTQVRVPVLRIQRSRRQTLRRDRRVERNPGRHRLKVSQVGQNAVADGFHLRGVGGVVHRDPTRPDTGGVAVGQQRVKSIRLTRDRHRTRTVHRCHRHPALIRGDQLSSALGRDTKRRHAARTRQLHDRQAAQRHNPRRIAQRERTRHARGGDLALRMPHHSSRPHAERLPQPSQRHHHRPQDRLHHIHPAHPVLLRGPQDLPQLPVHVRR
ncbi:putative protein OS=Streptomyces fumanus OX=67302 GN=GCM10018772_62410 PE=4 SV=1 [Streptomyces fumanus]